MSGFWKYSQIDELINQFFTVTSKQYRPMSETGSPFQSEIMPIYEILKRSDIGGNIKQVNQTLKKMGYMSLIRSHPVHESRGMLYIFPIPEKMIVAKQNSRTPIILFFLTIFSVFIVGVDMWGNLRSADPSLDPIIVGLLYVLSLMGIVGIHEIGHMVASRLHGIKASWPYFIPMPISLGTMGAFISQKTPIKSRNDLFDVGLAGPIFGFVVAILFSIIGLMNSFIIPVTEVPQDFSTALGFISLELDSPERARIILFEIIAYFFVPQHNSNMVVYLHPFAFAGFIGLFLTGLNLIPIGQSDGGHIARSMFSEQNHRFVTYLSAGVLVFLGFWFFAIILLFMYSQTGHSGPLDDLTELSFSRKIMTGLIAVLIVLTLPISPDSIFGGLISEIFPIFG
ncbi:MAG: site-2 protease family protein [Candidatus Hodarchaeales archaeon]|jgi:membrane-associated protease RseP (regulator of RpoE activity)